MRSLPPFFYAAKTHNTTLIILDFNTTSPEIANVVRVGGYISLLYPTCSFQDHTCYNVFLMRNAQYLNHYCESR